ncbi:MAG: DUF983 domain-containing protein [Crocinitomix sp.]|nr:DUF983 domain-containing protein [Crocinitomix sp.]
MKPIPTYRSIIGLKCPKCRKGELFEKPGLFRFKDVLLMPERCSVCQQKYLIEPGFWIGSLWTSYPIIVLIELPFLLTAVNYEGINIWACFGLMLVAFAVFFPLMLRVGRSIWIHIFIRYAPID